MQFVNDDMDDLFRKAAEDYPLSTEGSDWDKVAQKLDTAGTNITGKNNRKYWWLLLLLPIMFICNRFIYKADDINEDKVNKATATLSTTKGFKKVVTNKKEEKFSAQKNKDRSAFEPESIQVKEKTKPQFKEVSTATTNIKAKTANSNKEAEGKSAFTISLFSNISDIENINLPKKERAIPIPLHVLTNRNLNKIETNNLVRINGDSLMHEWNNIHNKETKGNNNKKWYAGIVVAPDVSFVKSTKTNGIGYSYGLIGGYRLSKKWSIETGLQKDKKNYYAEGEYFKSTKTYLPNHSKIIHATGSCYMTEVPLNIRYHFVEKGKMDWIISAGASSYFMQKESYQYLYERYGTQYTQNKIYNNKYSEWFSALNLSAGINKPLGRIGNLRVEPYVKIPLKGIGLGQLPVTSTGINIGLTKWIR